MRAIVWRVAAGDEDKDLTARMIEDQVMLIGPGVDDISHLSDSDVLKLACAPKITKRELEILIRFRADEKRGQLVVLRLGSVCFCVGAIVSKYCFDSRYDKVYSYWNPDGRFCLSEVPWKLQHKRDVHWYVLSDRKALCHFRKGIYGGASRFCRLRDTSRNISVRSAKKALDSYLCDELHYDNSNAEDILKKIGTPCRKVSEYGFPTG